MKLRSTVSTAVLLLPATAYFLIRFWNASLSMMPMTSDENRLSFAAARRTIARTVGMS